MNKVTKILFNGTKLDNIINIFSSQFRNAIWHIIGKGVYFKDILDYAYFFSNERKNVNHIPKVGETLSVIGSEIYYDNNKIEKVYNCETRNEKIFLFRL